MTGFALLGYLGKRFSHIFSLIKESGTTEIPGPFDNSSCVKAIADKTRVVYSSINGARYVSRDKTIYLSYPQGSKNLWALLEAVHEAGHASCPHFLVELLASSKLRKTFSLIVPATLSFFTGWLFQDYGFSVSLLFLLMAVPTLAVVAISHDEIKISNFSRVWLSSYLKNCGLEKYIALIEIMVRAEKIFMVLDGFALFLIFAGANISLWAMGGLL